MHKPKKVELKIFLATENSIGFNNKKKIPENKFGEVIVSKDITSFMVK